MKKFFVMTIVMLLQMTSLNAQSESNFYIINTYGGDKFGITGGEQGKSYMATFKSDKSKKELFDATIDMMINMMIIDEKDVNRNEVEDGMTEVNIPFSMNTGIGIHGGNAPLHLTGFLRFEFYDGGMKLKVEDLDESFFLVHYKPEMGQSGTETYQEYQKHYAKAREAAKATSGFGKFIAKVDKIQEITHISNRNGSLLKDAKNQVASKLNEANAERIQILEDYRSRIEEQEALFTRMAAAGEGKWYTLPEYIKEAEDCDYFTKYKKAADSFMKTYRTALEGNKLFDLTDKRWSRDIRYIFDGVFITLAENIEGSIESITEDGKMTWEREGDLVVPTDPKQKAKYVKKGKSFTDYESLDN